MNSLTKLRFVFVFLFSCLPLLLVSVANAQDQVPGAAKGVESSMLKQANAQGPFVNATFQQDDSTFSTTVFTFNDIVIFSYFEDTHITIVNSQSDTVVTDTLGSDSFSTQTLAQGTYSIYGSKSYTVLIGDPLTQSVQGYFAVDQTGRGTSTLLNTYMMQEEWGDERFIVFAYNDNTNFTITNLDNGSTLAAGNLDKGEHFTMPDTPYETFLQVSSNKAVSALAYGDQDYYVPASNGTFSGTLFYGYSAYIGGWTNSVTVTSYFPDNEVMVTNTANGDTLALDTLGTGQVISLPITEETYWKVQSSQTVTAANIPFTGWTGNYQYMARSIDQSGIGSGTLFYVPSIGSQIDVFSYVDGNDVTITRLGEYTNYPYSDSTIVYDETMNAGDGYNFDSPSGQYVYKIEGTGNLSVLQSYLGFGADFMPLSFAQQLPDLAVNEGGISFSPPDSELVANEEATVNVTVYNYGPVEANDVKLSLFDGDISSEGTAPVIATRTIASIGGNDSVTVSADFVVPEDPEFKDVSLQVDPENTITESNNSNNTIIRSLIPNRDLLPPLTVTTEAPSGLEIVDDTLQPNPFTVNVTIINNGTVEAEDVSIEFTTFDGLTRVEGDSLITRSTMAPDSAYRLSWQIEADPDSSGTNRYQLVVDASNAEIKTVKRSVNIPDLVPPQAPQGLTAISNDTTEGVVLQWSANTEADLSGYKIYYGTSSGSYDGTGADQGASPINVSTFTRYNITGLNDGTTYYFALNAFDQSQNESELSEEASAEVVTSLDPSEEMPGEYELKQNHPNPFNPTTVINYGIPTASHVQIEVYNLIGRRVAKLVDQRQNAGYHSVTFDASNLSSGIYIYRIKAKGFVQTRKMLLLK